MLVMLLTMLFIAQANAGALQQVTMMPVSATAAGYRYWRILSTLPGSGGTGDPAILLSEIRATYGGSEHALTSNTLTSIGTTFGLYNEITYLNDGITEITIGVNRGGVFTYPGTMDIKVDMGTSVTITSFGIAPDGDRNTSVSHTPVNLTFYYSNNGTDWTQTPTSYTNISTGCCADWNAAYFRSFSTGM